MDSRHTNSVRRLRSEKVPVLGCLPGRPRGPILRRVRTPSSFGIHEPIPFLFLHLPPDPRTRLADSRVRPARRGGGSPGGFTVRVGARSRHLFDVSTADPAERGPVDLLLPGPRALAAVRVHPADPETAWGGLKMHDARGASRSLSLTPPELVAPSVAVFPRTPGDPSQPLVLPRVSPRKPTPFRRRGSIGRSKGTTVAARRGFREGSARERSAKSRATPALE